MHHCTALLRWEVALRPWLHTHASDLLALAGVLALLRGVALLSPAAAWIVAGAVLVWVGWVDSRPASVPTR